MSDGLRINEIFHSIQGEGLFSGTPSTFVRTQGCSVGCFFCDTKESWNFKQGNLLSLEEIVEQLKHQHVVLTGGEPLESRQFDALCAMLIKHCTKLQIETSGVVSAKIPESVFLTVSPKFHTPRPILSDILERADEIKLVITQESDLAYLKRLPTDKLTFLQPESNASELIKLCIQQCLQDDRCRLSVQLHKLLGVP